MLIERCCMVVPSPGGLRHAAIEEQRRACKCAVERGVFSIHSNGRSLFSLGARSLSSVMAGLCVGLFGPAMRRPRRWWTASWRYRLSVPVRPGNAERRHDA